MSTGVSAILLAAGESQRMGQGNKLALHINGEPLLRRTVKTLLRAKLREVVVVLGHQQKSMHTLLDGLAIRWVGNGHYREGQMTSVYCGLQALQKPCAGVMVCLSDQPLLEVADINRLIDHFLATQTCVLVPTYQGRRGNPLILGAQYRDEILKGGRNLGCKHFIEKNPQWVTTLEFDNDRVVFDLDTQEDYARLTARLANRSAAAPLEGGY
ncbi:MAG: nucleotidyltransferase family protein [Gammaproteobacteria bacterium HGW-Gammaproteobacteria-3]|nr:MAG: nucleotidyltransferase family protein [Gammaproteobacteria bacterium HGW-Gammaproteobacteria-3]